MNPFVFVALDGLVKDEARTLSITEELKSVRGNFGFKINLDYVLRKGLMNAFLNIQRFGRPVFVDLKMWNGTRTMASMVRELVALKVDYLNVYALADELLPEITKITKDSGTKILGLTVLTHFNESYCKKHFRRSLAETVRHLSLTAVESGCHGIILPGTALHVVSDLNTLKVVPGVRPDWYSDTRHEEEITPREAVENGADILVCGSPIMKVSNPVGALEKILSEIA